MRHRFVQFTAADAEVAEIIVGKIIVGGDGESMRPKRLAVSPGRRLSEVRACQGSNDHYGACDSCTTPYSGLAHYCYVANSPNCDQKQTDGWKVGITVGMALFTNLNKSNHRNQHKKVPEPTRKQIRSLISPNDCRTSDGKKECNRENNLPSCQSIIWMRIKNGEARRPQCFPGVNGVTHDCILRSPEKRQRRERANGAFLHCKCDDTGARGKDEQGNLFQKKSLYYAPLIV